MKKVLFLAVGVLTVVGCASEDYVGDKDLHEANMNGIPMSFNLVAAPQTRAGSADYADALNNTFVVYGRKTYVSPSATPQVVFDNYLVVWSANSAYTTTSNSADWEYVGYYNLPAGTSNNTGIPEAKPSPAPNDRYEQTIKYWDFSANEYDFFAYSLGKGVTSNSTTTYANASVLGYNSTDGYTYTLSGNNAQLAACYISDLKKKNDQTTNQQVQLNFRKLGSKVKIALYETIPGYSVKDVKFYPSASAETSGTTAYLYAASASMPNEGSYKVTFADDGTPTLRWTAKAGSQDLASISFGDAVTTEGTTWTGWASKDYREAEETVYIGRSSNAATGPTGFLSVLPNPGNTQTLTLKIDYTLLSRDGYGETIEVKGATAVVPAQYAAWKPNCSYTYLFKISDNSNGYTGPDTKPSGLYPITLDAVVNVDAAGKQETITTVTEPSITTYQEGSDYATTNEYKAGLIYVMVENGTVLTLGTNAKLWKVEVTGSNPNVTEASVAEAIANYPAAGHDANGNPMTVTLVASDASDKLTLTDDSKKAVFNASAGTIYVFQYIGSLSDSCYKVIKVAPAS